MHLDNCNETSISKQQTYCKEVKVAIFLLKPWTYNFVHHRVLFS